MLPKEHAPKALELTKRHCLVPGKTLTGNERDCPWGLCARPDLQCIDVVDTPTATRLRDGEQRTR